MTLDEIELELVKPENNKYSKYLNSFWILTDDEQDKVRLKHKGLDAYLTLFEESARLHCEAIQKALEVGGLSALHGSLGGALQVEDLEATLKLVTFEDRHLKLHKII